MYALLSAGEDGGSFVAARDPVGIKPLYWRRAAARSATCASPRRSPPSTPTGAPTSRRSRRATTGRPDGRAAALRRARSCPPARAATATEAGRSPREDDLDETRERSSRRRPPADGRRPGGRVPLRRPGLDAGRRDRRALCAERGQRLQTFAVGVEGSPDVLAARQAAEYLDTDHHERLYTAEEALAARAAGRARDRALRRLAGAQRRAELPAGRDDRPPREGRAHRRGRRRAVRRLQYLRDFADPDSCTTS